MYRLSFGHCPHNGDIAAAAGQHPKVIVVQEVIIMLQQPCRTFTVRQSKQISVQSD